MEIYDSLMAIYDNLWQEIFMSSLIEFYGHFPARSANSFMNIYVFIDWNLWPFPSAKRKTIQEHLWLHWLKFMIIPSAKRKFIYEHLLLHWWSFLTKKARSAKPFMNIYCFIDDHFWLKKSAERKTNISLISFLTKKNPFKSRIHE